MTAAATSKKIYKSAVIHTFMTVIMFLGTSTLVQHTIILQAVWRMEIFRSRTFLSDELVGICLGAERPRNLSVLHAIVSN